MKVSASATVTSAVQPWSRSTLANSIAPQVRPGCSTTICPSFRCGRSRPGNIAWAEEGTTTMIISACSSASAISEVTSASLPNPRGPPSQLSRSIPPRSLIAAI